MYALARTTNNILFNLSFHLFNYLIKNKLQYVKTHALIFFEHSLILYFQVNISCFKDNKTKCNDIEYMHAFIKQLFMFFIDFNTVSLRIVLVAVFIIMYDLSKWSLRR